MTTLRAAPFCAGLILALTAPATMAATFLYSDQTSDEIRFTRDLNGDGDANDAGESIRFFGAGNKSGLDATGNVFAITQAKDGSVFYGDGATDAVYRLRDKNGDNTAMGKGEAGRWFSEKNAAGFKLHTPNGVAQGADGAIYVVEADVLSDQSGDRVYRTVDLNGDGDAEDAGEATIWLDLKALNLSSSPFEIKFDGDAAYIADTRGTDSNVIYRARDENGDGVVSKSEVTEFIRDDNSFGVAVDFALSAGDGSVFSWEFLNFKGPNSLFKLTDLNGNGVIDASDEWKKVWDSTLLKGDLSVFAAFGMARGADGSILLTSNAGKPEGDNLIRLVDLNGDGDFNDPGETFSWLSRSINGAYPQRARAAAWYAPVGPAPVPLPATGLLLAAGVAALTAARRRA